MVLKVVITGSDLDDGGFIRRVFESCVANESNRHRNGALAVTGEAFVAQSGEQGGGDMNMHGWLDALGAPNIPLLTPYSCSPMPTCPKYVSLQSRERRTRRQDASKAP